MTNSKHRKLDDLGKEELLEILKLIIPNQPIELSTEARERAEYFDELLERTSRTCMKDLSFILQ